MKRYKRSVILPWFKLLTVVALITVFLVTNYFFPIIPKIKKVFGADLGSIEVCQVVSDGSGNITNGSAQSGTQFRLEWFRPAAYTSPLEAGPASGVPSANVFTTPLTLNTKISGFPDGPGAGGNNAQCVTISNLTMDQTYSGYDAGFYYYRQQQVTGGSTWSTTLYNDGWTTAVSSSNLFAYDGSLFDANASNDAARNVNSDGNITLGFDPLTSTYRNNRRLVVYNQYGLGTAGGSGSCSGGSCTTKEIGTINGVYDTFSSQSELELGRSYWVRVAVRGQDVTTSGSGGSSYPGSDIMMILDASGSMGDPLPVNSNGSGGTVSRAEAAKSALKQFVSNSDEAKDWIGLGTMIWCIRYNNTTTPVPWYYQRYFPSDPQQYIGVSALHRFLSSISGQKTQVNNIIDSINFYYANVNNPSVPNYCTTVYGSKSGQTSIAGGLSAANTQLTPILTTPAGRNYVSNNFLGAGGTNNGPFSRGGAVKKYIILATDGHESAAPKLDQNDLDNVGNTPLETAVANNITIHTIGFSDPNDSYSQVLKNISAATGGSFYGGRSQQEILSSIGSIRNDIGAVSSTGPARVSINEIINVNYFKIDEPTYSGSPTFIIKRPRTGSEPADFDLSNSLCPDNHPANGTPDCISNKQYSGGNLVGYQVDLGTLGAGEVRYVYFRVTPTASSNFPINVDSSSSTITYQNAVPATISLDNTNVSIKTLNSYFQINSGDVYSHSSSLNAIKSLLPSNTRFNLNPGDISLTRGYSNYGEGTQGNPPRDLSTYTYQNLPQTFSELLNSYNNSIIDDRNITGINSFTESGYYIDRNAIANGQQDYRLSGGNWRNQQLRDKKVVFFVPGNLFIEEPFDILGNGKSSLTFIVGGNVGIAPNVNSIKGIYIIEGAFDSECERSKGFVAGKCDSTTPAAASLNAQGTFVASGGFNLDRVGVGGSVPGEIFSYKPEYTLAAIDAMGNKIFYWKENKQ